MKIRPQKIAVLQIVPKNQGLLPNSLVQALALLEKHSINYRFYDLESAAEDEIGAAVHNLLASIEEQEVLVALSCHFNYPKMASLIFLQLEPQLLKGKKLHICSPYLSFYDLSGWRDAGVEFHFEEIDAYVERVFKLRPLARRDVLAIYPAMLDKYGYAGRQWWSFLAASCDCRCSFCHNRSLAKQSSSRYRVEPEDVVSRMKMARVLGAHYFQIADPSFFNDQLRANTLLDLLIQDPVGLPWRCKVRLDQIDAGRYEKLVAAGCDTIFFGFEHVSARLLRNMNKGERSIELLTDFMRYWGSKVELDVSFLTGIRGERVDDLRDNLAFIAKLARHPGIRCSLGYIILYYRARRQRSYVNCLVAMLFIMNFIPERMSAGKPFIRRVMALCREERFFRFGILTENASSLGLFKELERACRAKQLKEPLEDFYRLMEFNGGELAGMIARARSLESLNKTILAW
ncbi:MAG: hypothetical protein HGA80_06435 [Candidatus Omnitrophica bacterium]|nr:hypothetical protein [Candidatus Omnitrophota bacterium]